MMLQTVRVDDWATFISINTEFSKLDLQWGINKISGYLPNYRDKDVCGVKTFNGVNCCSFSRSVNVASDWDKIKINNGFIDHPQVLRHCKFLLNSLGSCCLACSYNLCLYHRCDLRKTADKSKSSVLKVRNMISSFSRKVKITTWWTFIKGPGSLPEDRQSH